MAMPTPLPVRLAGSAFRLAGAVAPEWTAIVLNRLTFHPLRTQVSPWQRAGLEQAERVHFGAGPDRLPGLVWTPRSAGERGRDGGAAPPQGTVLMVHGWEGRASQFGPLGLALAEAGLRAVALDLPAHGEAPRRASTPRRWIDGVGSALEALGPLAGLVTHSMGAGPSLMALGEGRRAERMVAISPPSAMEPRMRTAAQRIGVTGRTAAAFARRSTAKIVAHGGAADFAALAQRFAPPLLVLHAPDDDVVAIDEGKRLAAAADGQFVETAAHGHFRILREAETLQAVCRYLTGEDAPEQARPARSIVRPQEA